MSGCFFETRCILMSISSCVCNCISSLLLNVSLMQNLTELTANTAYNKAKENTGSNEFMYGVVTREI